MKVLRRTALVLGLALVVAVTVAYFTRQSEAASSRDLRLASSAELAASEVASLVELVEVAVQAGGEPRSAADSISQLVPRLSVCVANAVRVECAGERPEGLLDSAEAYQQEFRASDLEDDETFSDVGTEPTPLSVFDRVVTIHVSGAQLAVVVSVTSDDLFAELDTELWVAETPADGGGRDGFVVTNGTRQTYAPIGGATGLVVVASAENAASVSASEMTFYLMLGGLAALLLLLAGATSLLEHRSLIERASIDPLTRLPNRGEFERISEAEISTAERTGVGFALLMFDLNGFKTVNDTYGHQAGDELLQIVAERLQHTTRDTDVVARWGGDEFVVLMPGVTSIEMGGRRARQIADAIAGRARLDSAPDAVRVKASVGVSVWPLNGSTMHELMAAADAAMYHAKRHHLVAAVAGDHSTFDLSPDVIDGTIENTVDVVEPPAAAVASDGATETDLG